MASFSTICFADLKKYKFTYLFGFPALHSEPSWTFDTDPDSVTESATDELSKAHESPFSRLTPDEATALVDSVQTWRYSVDARQYGFFLAKKVRDEVSEDKTDYLSTPGLEIGFAWVVRSLVSYEEGFFDDVHPADRFICFADPSTYSTHPGWMLRNLLVLVRQRWKLDRVQILCYRDVQASRHEARSVIMQLKIEETTPPAPDVTSDDMPVAAQPTPMPRVTGWERSNSGKVASKVANLGEYMDPQRQAQRHILLFGQLANYILQVS